jgi:hypothetical protein
MLLLYIFFTNYLNVDFFYILCLCKVFIYLIKEVEFIYFILENIIVSYSLTNFSLNIIY